MSQLIRAFVSIELPLIAKSVLDRAKSQLNATPEKVYRLSDLEQSHLTLYFLGEITPETLDHCSERLAQVRARQVSLRIGGLVTLPSQTVPKVLAAGVSGDLTGLNQLQRRIQDTVFPYEVFKETRAYFPHVTFARLSKGVPANAKVVKRTLKSIDVAVSPEFLVDSFHLFTSSMEGDSHAYHLVRSYSLNPV